MAVIVLVLRFETLSQSEKCSVVMILVPSNRNTNHLYLSKNYNASVTQQALFCKLISALLSSYGVI